MSITVEIRRDLYLMKLFLKNENYYKIKDILTKIIKSVGDEYFQNI